MALPNLPIYVASWETIATVNTTRPALVKVDVPVGSGSAIYASPFPNEADAIAFTNMIVAPVDIYDAAGNLMNGVTTGYGYYDLPAAGTYYVHINDTSAAGSFALMIANHLSFGDAGALTKTVATSYVAPNPVQEAIDAWWAISPLYKPATYTVIPLDDAGSTILLEADRKAVVYTYTPTSYEQVSFRITEATTSFNLVTAVYSSDGNRINGNVGVVNGENTLRYPVEAGKTYYFMTLAAGANAQGTHQLLVVKHLFSAVTPVQFGNTAANLVANETDRFTFTSTQRGVTTVSIEGLSGVTLFADAGGRNIISTTGTLTFISNANENVSLEVFSSTDLNTVGNYTLSVTEAAAPPISDLAGFTAFNYLGDLTRTGVLTEGAQTITCDGGNNISAYTMHVTTGGSLSAATTIDGLDTRLYLYDSNGNKISDHDDIDYDAGLVGSLLETQVTAGTYYLFARSYADTPAETFLTIAGVTLSPTPPVATPTRSNVKFSQKSIKGLPEALAALASAVTNQGSTGAQALTDAIAQEVADRNAAISGAIAQEVTDRNSAISTAVQGVLGSAPEAFDTLKEIADYIAVNPSATVADAINAAIAAANAATTALTAAVDAEKAYSDWKSSQALRLKGDVITLTGTLTDSKAVVTTTHPVEMVLNYGFARLTNIVLGEVYDLPVTVAAGVASIDFAGYETEAADLTQFTGVIQYVYKVDATTERASFAAL
jgi:hypothetical protein